MASLISICLFVFFFLKQTMQKMQQADVCNANSPAIFVRKFLGLRPTQRNEYPTSNYTKNIIASTAIQFRIENSFWNHFIMVLWSTYPGTIHQSAFGSHNAVVTWTWCIITRDPISDPAILKFKCVQMQQWISISYSVIFGVNATQEWGT